MIKSVFFLIFVVFTGSLAWAAEVETLPQIRVLKRLSFQLRGRAPDLSDYAEFLAIKSSTERKAHLEHLASEYLSSKEFGNVIDRRLSRLFYLNSAIFQEHGPSQNILNRLFRDIAIENRPWKELLTAKNYSVEESASEESSSSILDRDYFAYVTELINGRFSFSEDDSRIAGAITTFRFQSRYTTTALNKNRRRAAAIFRIGLCDSMKAVVETGDGRDDDLWELSKDQNHRFFPPGKLEEILGTLSGDDPHGKNSACMACHYKLDPMGQSLVGLNSKLSPSPWAGALSFTNSNGNKIFIEGQGIGDLMNHLTTQEDYLQCQSERLAKWVFGQDRYLASSRKQELHQNFRNLGERVQDYFKYLVAQPEFSTVMVLNERELLGVETKDIFKRCDSCHGLPGADTPAFSVWPIGGDKSSARYWATRIESLLDLKNQGKNPKMPPSYAGWKLGPDELSGVSNWIKAGGPDENGKSTLEESL